MTFGEKILEAAQEGLVLLRNENEVLPFVKTDRVSVFGRTQIDYYKSGTGSGGSVHCPYSTNLIDSMLELAAEESSAKVDKELVAVYRNWIKDNPFDNAGGMWASEPASQKDMDLKSELVEKCAKVSNKALFVIGRTAGEDQDFHAEKGSYYLRDEEKANLKLICSAFDNVTVLLNISGIIDMSWVSDLAYKGHIKAIIVAWDGGQESGRAAARVLMGKATPCGKLTDTVALSLDDYPSTKNFGNPNRSVYTDDIYVGYRYFMTFARDKILFPFGYGLSYTSFSLDKVELNSSKDGNFTVSVTVKNTGRTYSGKEIVQVYCEAPQGKLGKAGRVLCAFAKTRLLACGESERLTLVFKLSDFASYDESGVTGNKSCMVLEQGDYKFYVGTDSLSANAVLVDGKDAYHLEKDLITQRLEQALAPVEAFDRIVPGEAKADGTFSESYAPVTLSAVDMPARIRENLPKDIAYTGFKGITFEDVKKDNSKMKDFVAQMSDDELATLARGEGMLSEKVTKGIAAAYGGVSPVLHDKYKVPVAGCSDGPSGIRLDTGKEASLMPSGTMLACSWNLDLVRELYVFEGKELAENKIDALLGPGMNIHRNPLCGRNFEYFSEDPLLTGRMAVAELEGLLQSGVHGTIKHFAANSQETGRRTCNAVVSERALREVYLRGFEIAVKEGNACSVMTAYNPVNGHWTASNYDLVNTILHREWGFKGLVMTDWWAGMNDCVTGGEQTVKNTAAMIRARNNVYMVVDNDGAESNVYGDNIAESLKNGSLTRGELQLSAIDVLAFILRANVSKRELGLLKNLEVFKALGTKLPDGARLVKDGETFAVEEGNKAYIDVKEDSEYCIMGEYKKEGDDLSQSATNVMIDGRSAASFQCRSTLGKYTNVNAGKVFLCAGLHELTLVSTKPGIEVKELMLSSKDLLRPVTAGRLK